MPFIHVARAQSSNTLGPQASCTPADRGRVCNNADMHSTYIYEVWDAWDVWDVWDAWDVWDVWDAWDDMLSIYMWYGMQYEGQQLCVCTGCTNDIDYVLSCQWL